MATRKCRNIYLPKYLSSEIFYGRQEVHKYFYPDIFCTSVSINGRFRYTLFLVCFILCHVPLLHKKSYGPTEHGIVT